MSPLRRMLIRVLVLAVAAFGTHTAAAKTLKVGITLHPYYSFVANIVGDRAEIVPLIDADANPHGYAPQPADMIRITSMDVLVVNGIGHDSWAFEILDAAGMRDKLTLIYANDGVSLIPVAGDPSGAKVVNPHTFISTTAAIQQVYTDRPTARRARSGERRVLSRQRAALRARDSQAARRVRRADRRREFGQVPLRDDAQRLRLHPPGARFAGHRRHRAAPWRRAHGAAARRDDRPHQGGRRQRAVRREVFREQAVRHDPRGHGRQDVLDLAHQQRRVHGREIRRRDARELGRRSPRPSTKRARAVSKPCRVQRSSSSAST